MGVRETRTDPRRGVGSFPLASFEVVDGFGFIRFPGVGFVGVGDGL